MLRRRNDAAGTGVLEDAVRCAMCGTTVPVGPDGRCDLGHRVVVVQHLSSLPVEASPAETGAAVPPAPAAAATPPPPAAAPEARPSDDPFFHPYDEVLADEPAAPADPPTPSAPPAPPEAEGLAPEELEDLLSWSDDLT